MFVRRCTFPKVKLDGIRISKDYHQISFYIKYHMFSLSAYSKNHPWFVKRFIVIVRFDMSVFYAALRSKDPYLHPRKASVVEIIRSVHSTSRISKFDSFHLCFFSSYRVRDTCVKSSFLICYDPLFCLLLVMCINNRIGKCYLSFSLLCARRQDYIYFQ